MKKISVNVMMVSAGIKSGSFRRMQDIIRYYQKSNYKFFVTYKPRIADWGKYEIDSLVNSGAELIPIRGNRIFDLKGFLDIWRTIKRKKINILHCWDVLGIPVRILGSFAHIKIVEEFANPPPSVGQTISLKHYLLNRITSVLVHGYVGCSNGILKKYQNKKSVVLTNKIQSVIYNCVEIPKLNTAQENNRLIRLKYKLPDKAIIISTIGYFNKQKAQWDLILAFQEVLKTKNDVTLVIVGWGPLENKLKRLVINLQLKDNVFFTGKLTRSEVFEILAITELFALSSHWEGFGIVLIEAMAMGKPIVATDTDGSREVVQNGKTGIIVQPGSPKIMGEAIMEMLRNSDQMKRMGAQGFKRVQELFNQRQFIQGYENFYQSVLR